MFYSETYFILRCVLIWKVSGAVFLQYNYMKANGFLGSNISTPFITVEDVRSQVACAILCAGYRCCRSFVFEATNLKCQMYSHTSNDEIFSPFASQLFNFQYLDVKDCGDVVHCSGVYTVTPVPNQTFDVYCDTDTSNGPWTVFQKRFDGTVDFYREWNDYKQGFGDLDGEFWLGMEHIRSLVSLGQMLHVSLEGWDGTCKYAEYTTVDIASEEDFYQLTVEGYSGNAPDRLQYHNGKDFSTRDRDNDKAPFSCSSSFQGAWWYSWCHTSNLNGPYKNDSGQSDSASMTWGDFYSDRAHPPLKKSTMMLKRP